jgi:hypothetical protein
MRYSSLRTAGTMLVCSLVVGWWGTAPRAAPTADALLFAAGDIAACDSGGDEQTAAILGAEPGAIQTLGDNVYDDGSTSEFFGCYSPSWGQFKERTTPAIGNHEYGTPGAQGYFTYFGPAAGEPGKGYYSYDLGAWHIVVLNSNCGQVGCSPGSPQETWLRSDLAAHATACLLAAWHHPRFSSGSHGGYPEVQPFWNALDDYGADVVLNGHDHDYERFAPQNSSGAADPSGIREFVVGTGGKDLAGFPTVAANSEIRSADSFGVLRLTLSEQSYSWRFLPVAGQSFTDVGAANCTPLQPAPLPSEPPPPSTTATQKSSPLLVVRPARVRLTRRGVVRIAVSCLNAGKAPCRGRLSLRPLVPQPQGHSVPRAIALGPARFALALGKRTIVPIRLTERARRSLARRRVLWVRAVAHLQGGKQHTSPPFRLNRRRRR